ncbi:hypothetical protein [uncultured Micrococcus sp.]|uniref:hypothetical protein n=1 Tax=uncultured Micrococcus sp. TaxID=114051 RepID=UPI0025E18E97|nr:hypothetical protein [uncultured Micrococcus sp.]
MATITLNRHELAVALHIGPVAALHGDDTGHPIYLEVLHRGTVRVCSLSDAGRSTATIIGTGAWERPTTLCLPRHGLQRLRQHLAADDAVHEVTIAHEGHWLTLTPTGGPAATVAVSPSPTPAPERAHTLPEYAPGPPPRDPRMDPAMLEDLRAEPCLRSPPTFYGVPGAPQWIDWRAGLWAHGRIRAADNADTTAA